MNQAGRAARNSDAGQGSGKHSPHGHDAGSSGRTNVEILYISYDGLLEPIGQSQVVNYLVGLAPGYRQTVLSFEKQADLRDRESFLRLSGTLAGAGIRWVPCRYHKWPHVLSTLWDVVVGFMQGNRICRRRRIDIIHARGYVPALIAVMLKRLHGGRFVFDMRGFWPEEKVDAGHWSRESVIYAVTKKCERLFFRAADAVVSLTVDGFNAIRELGYILPSNTAVSVIPTCTDLNRFSPGPKDRSLIHRYGLDGRLVIGCTGTMSNWYLRQPMLTCLSYFVRRMDGVKFLLVTREDHDQLRRDLLGVGISDEQFVLARVPFPAMPAHVRLMDVGLFFIKPAFSKRGSAATKLGEFLATGVPVIINDGVGDSGSIVRRHSVGVVLANTTTEEFEASLTTVREVLHDPEIGKRCREVAQRYFDLDAGIRQYHELYSELISTADTAQR